MTLFVDASALVAIVAEEDGHEALELFISESDCALWSPLSRWETVRAVARLLEISIASAGEVVDLYASSYLTMVPIGAEEASLALEAHQRYGKGNHGARLNMGDCFAYACAKAHGARLLYKGDDFSRTDLA